MVKKLTKNMNDRVFSGVCSGIAKHFNQDPTIIRVLFALVTVFTGFMPGIIAYIILAIIIPQK